MDLNEINALIRLLDDTDQEVYAHIEGKLVSYGKEVIPFLENAWGYSFDAILQQRIIDIIHKIQFDHLRADLAQWAKSPDQNLLTGAMLMARYQYPDLDEESIRQQIDKIRKDVWLELNDNLTALERVRVLNHIFFEVYNFSGNASNYHAPQNSFINVVLETKKGNPLLLAILYSVVAQQIDIPIYGVNLPEHFIVAYMSDASPESHVLFYVNPFSKGSVFDKKEIDSFLKQLNVPEEKDYYRPCSNLLILQRLIRNLMYSYQKAGNHENIDELQLLMDAINKEH
jgi:regulator of sirC expression with transglutaminase-like and TPR domain